MTTGKCRSHFSLKELPFATERDHYRKPQLNKIQRMSNLGVPSPFQLAHL